MVHLVRSTCRHKWLGISQLRRLARLSYRRLVWSESGPLSWAMCGRAHPQLQLRPGSRAQGQVSTSIGKCKVRCWGWLFGNKILISLPSSDLTGLRVPAGFASQTLDCSVGKFIRIAVRPYPTSVSPPVTCEEKSTPSRGGTVPPESKLGCGLQRAFVQRESSLLTTYWSESTLSSR